MTATFPVEASVFALAKPLIQKWESFSATPYICPAGKPTIGWGSTRYPIGTAVTMKDSAIDKSVGEIILVFAMRRVRDSLIPCLTRTPTIHQAAALISLAFNIGVGLHDGIKGDLADSTLLAKFNAGDFQSAASHFRDWVYVHKNGKPVKLTGLVNRREDEHAMFLHAD